MRKIIILCAFLSAIFLNSKNLQAQQAEAVILADTLEQTEAFKMLSWNIYMLPPAIGFTGKRKRASHIGQQLSDGKYDVLVLQEAFHHGARRKIVKELKHQYPHRIGPVYKRGFSLKTSSGIWILSKHPMKTLGKTRFKNAYGFDNKMARKGALMVEVDKNGQKFQIVGTHLNAGGSLALRSSQVRQIREDLLDKHRDEEIPLIVAGDFNIDQLNPEGMDSMTCILDMGEYALQGDQPYTFDDKTNDLMKGKGRGIIDFIFFDQGFLRLKALRRHVPKIQSQWASNHQSLSDHNPLEIDLHYSK